MKDYAIDRSNSGRSIAWNNHQYVENIIILAVPLAICCLQQPTPFKHNLSRKWFSESKGASAWSFTFYLSVEILSENGEYKYYYALNARDNSRGAFNLWLLWSWQSINIWQRNFSNLGRIFRDRFHDSWFLDITLFSLYFELIWLQNITTW